MNLFTRANRLATQERWNVPQVRTSSISISLHFLYVSSDICHAMQVPDSTTPSVINIQVTTEMRGDADKRVSKNQTANMDEFRRMDWKMSR